MPLSILELAFFHLIISSFDLLITILMLILLKIIAIIILDNYF